ncbi:hypothetical protein R1sor_002860 [Riccia sorocarpa]|uniref:Uncharacterized protein n=1 Tax=Riccia sorocarpa TaxID=122646 RepID=A0ABD3H0C0_9MARC
MDEIQAEAEQEGSSGSMHSTEMAVGSDERRFGGQVPMDREDYEALTTPEMEAVGTNAQRLQKAEGIAGQTPMKHVRQYGCTKIQFVGPRFDHLDFLYSPDPSNIPVGLAFTGVFFPSFSCVLLS